MKQHEINAQIAALRKQIEELEAQKDRLLKLLGESTGILEAFSTQSHTAMFQVRVNNAAVTEAESQS